MANAQKDINPPFIFNIVFLPFSLYEKKYIYAIKKREKENKDIYFLLRFFNLINKIKSKKYLISYYAKNISHSESENLPRKKIAPLRQRQRTLGQKNTLKSLKGLKSPLNTLEGILSLLTFFF